MNSSIELEGSSLKFTSPVGTNVVLKGKIFYDQRGFLREAYKKKIIKKNLIFAIISKSKKNVLRGLHMQMKNSQDKYLSVLKGKILDVAVDARKNSKTYGKHHKVILSDKNGKSFFIPKGFLHGFLGLEKENIVLYGCTNYRHKQSEITVNWNDLIRSWAPHGSFSF